MRRLKGNALLNLIITIAVIGVILSLTVPFIKKMFFAEKETGVEIKSQIYLVKGKATLESDLLNAGVGLPCRSDNCPALPVEWDGNSLAVRYEKDPDREPVYALLDCDGVSCTVVESSYTEKLKTSAVNTNRDKCYYIGEFRLRSGDVIVNPGVVSLLKDDVYVAFGVKKYNGCSYEGLAVGFPCVKTVYELKDNPGCPAGTKKLVRETTTGEEVLYPCVASWKILVDYDTDGDGKIDAGEFLQDRKIESKADIEKARAVKVFVLYTTKKKIGDKVVPYFKDGKPYIRVVIKGKEVLLPLPNDYQGYRWRIAVVSAPLENTMMRDTK